MPTQGEISLSPVSAKGDILTHDGSSRARLAVGSNNSILTARSTSAFGIAWESKTVNVGDFVLIGSSTSTASATSMSITNVSQSSYQHFLLTGSMVGLSGTFNGGIVMTNSQSASGTFPWIFVQTDTGGIERNYNDNDTVLRIANSATSANGNMYFRVVFFNWGIGGNTDQSTANGVIFESSFALPTASEGNTYGVSNQENGTWVSSTTGSLSTLVIKSAQNDGSFGAGSTIKLWGIKKIDRTYAG